MNTISGPSPRVTAGMRQVAALASTALVALVALAGSTSTASAQTAIAHPATERRVHESAGTQSTGIDVVAGQRVMVDASPYDKIWSGCWGWSPNGPEGTSSCSWQAMPLPSAPAYGLLAGVGTKFTHVGRGASFYAPATGTLYLKINDDVPGNGSGFFTAVVSTTTEVAPPVPNVVGLWEHEAAAKLEAAGFGWAASYKATHCGAEGKVTSQSPASGAYFYRPTNVAISVGAGPDGDPWTLC